MGETRDPVGLGRTVIILIYVLLAVGACSAAAALNTIRVLGGFGGGIAAMPALEATDRYSIIFGGLYLAVFIVAGITVLRWIHRVARNAHAFSDAMSMSPGWTVGALFVPIANLFKPFQGVREAWQATADPGDPASIPVPGMMRLWWGAWLVSSVHGNVLFRLTLDAKTPDELIRVGWLEVVGFPVEIVLAIALAWLVRRLSALQLSMIEGSEVARVFE